MTSDKIKMWKVYVEDHEIVGKLFRHDQTQPMVFQDLIVEPAIMKILDEKLYKADLMNEAGKKGNAALSLQAANLALSALKEIREILLKRIRQYFSEEDKQELRTILEKVKALEPLLKDKYEEGEKEEVQNRIHEVTNDLARFMGEPELHWKGDKLVPTKESDNDA